MSWSGDVGDDGITVWHEGSGELVYDWFNGRLSAGCYPERTVGTSPNCDEWSDACAGGAGGAGGAVAGECGTAAGEGGAGGVGGAA